MIIFDPWCNAAVERQAIDRAHRIGQHKKVSAYKMITKNTIEEKILLLQEKKKDLVDNIISADSGSFLKNFNSDEILSFFS